jgi:WD40 repeat protein
MSLRRLILVAVLVALFAPPSASAALIAAYDKYVVGKGFEIGLVNVSTGAAISLPSGVNTAADELHPALSANGRFLWFARTQLQPGLNGEVIPPAARSLVRVDRNSGTVTILPSDDGGGYGAVFTDFGRPGIAYGKRPTPRTDSTKLEYGLSQVIDPSTGAPTGGIERVALTAASFVTGAIVETTQAAFEWKSSSIGRSYLAASAFDAAGALQASNIRIESFGSGAQSAGLSGFASHPMPRPGDSYVVYQSKYGSQAQIFSFTFPTLPAQAAPGTINTSAYEGMPAWSPDLGKFLGFVRITNARRTLLAFDTTPGIQDALNAPIDLGAEAPTPQLRNYQDVFGGLSLANITTVSVPNLTCGVCATTSGGPGTTLLSPTVTAPSLIGILVARVKGTTTLFGRKVPKITPVGRVPLGKTKKGRNSFKWNGKVEGKKLKKGTYLLTFRALKGDRILNTSGSVRFKVDRKGRPSGFKTLR